MKFLQIENLLKHLRLEAGEEDEYVKVLGQTAEEVVERYLNRPLEEVYEEYGSMPKSVIHACYLIVADLWENREATGAVQRHENGMVRVLLKPYKKLSKR